MDNRFISKEGIDLIAAFEGFSPVAYYATKHEKEQDMMTIGFGHLINDDTEDHLRDAVLTKEDAIEMLEGDVGTYVEAVLKADKLKLLNRNQLDAAVSFCYNVGVGNFAKSQFSKDIVNKDFVSAANNLKWWTLQAGQRLKGLVVRRATEKVFFNTGVNRLEEFRSGKLDPFKELGL